MRALGDRLGPIRVSLQSARDDGILELLLGSLDPSLRLAFDLEHPSWNGVEERLAAAGAVRVNDLVTPAPFRYIRMRQPPYDEHALEALAERVRSVRRADVRLLQARGRADGACVRARLLELLES